MKLCICRPLPMQLPRYGSNGYVCFFSLGECCGAIDVSYFYTIIKLICVACRSGIIRLMNLPSLSRIENSEHVFMIYVTCRYKMSRKSRNTIERVTYKHIPALVNSFSLSTIMHMQYKPFNPAVFFLIWHNNFTFIIPVHIFLFT